MKFIVDVEDTEPVSTSGDGGFSSRVKIILSLTESY